MYKYSDLLFTSQFPYLLYFSIFLQQDFSGNFPAQPFPHSNISILSFVILSFYQLPHSSLPKPKCHENLYIDLCCYLFCLLSFLYVVSSIQANWTNTQLITELNCFCYLSLELLFLERCFPSYLAQVTFVSFYSFHPRKSNLPCPHVKQLKSGSLPDSMWIHFITRHIILGAELKTIKCIKILDYNKTPH